MADANLLDTLTEVEDSQGRILTGAGVSTDALEETIEAHEERKTPAPADADASAPPAPDAKVSGESDVRHDGDSRTRDDKGQFTKPPRGQRRFDQLTKEREDARREAQSYKDRLDKLEAELKARPAPGSSPPVAPVPAAPTPVAPVVALGPERAATPQRPMPDEVGTKYQTWKDYEDALWDWRNREQQRQILDLIQGTLGEREATNAFKGHVNEVWAKGREKYPDFDAKLKDPAFDAITFPGPTLQAIAEAPASEDIQYRLASDHALAQRLAAETNPYRVGMILASLSGSPPAPSPASGLAPAPPMPPPPYQPVGGRAKSATPSLEELADSGGDDYDKSGYRERRRREREGR